MSVAGYEPDVAAADDRERAEAVELQLVQPAGIIERLAMSTSGAAKSGESALRYRYARGLGGARKRGENPAYQRLGQISGTQ